jgi:hypothetical protein
MTNQLAIARNRAAVDHVIERVLEGQPLRLAIAEAGVGVTTFNKWLQSDKDAATSYARATELRADLLADEALHLADGAGDPAKVRNQMTIRQWLAGKLNGKRYGDRIDLNVTQTLDISGTLSEARARMLSARYQPDVIDAQPVDSIDVVPLRAIDKQSVDRVIDQPVDGAEPDIFS